MMMMIVDDAGDSTVLLHCLAIKLEVAWGGRRIISESVARGPTWKSLVFATPSTLE